MRAVTAHVLLLSLVSAACAEIPEHPSKLVFPPLDYTPPVRTDHRHVLRCGVPVYVVEDHELPLVDVTVLVRAGSYLEPDSKAGLAALTGSQLRRGGTQKQTPEELDEELAFLAAEMSASIDETEGSVTFNCLRKDLDRVLEIFFDVLRTPRFDPARLELEKNQEIQDLARRNDRTAEIENREWERILRGTKFFSVDHVTEETLKSITRDDLVQFHRRYFHSKNFIFAVAGDVVTKDILERIEKALAAWPAGDPAPVPPVPKPEHQPLAGVSIVDKPSVNQGRVSIGHLATTRDNPDLHALTVMNHILGAGGFTSRIMSRVRSDEGLAYSARSRFDFGVWYDGDFRATFQSKSESVARATAIVIEEIEKLRTEKVREEERTTAVNYFVGSFPRLFATPRLVATTFARDEYTGRDPDFWRFYRERMDGVTADDILRVSNEYLRPDRLAILVVGNRQDILKGDAAGVLKKLAGEKGIRGIPLPDPLTLVYPSD